MVREVTEEDRALWDARHSAAGSRHLEEPGIPAEFAPSREIQALFKVLTSPWLLAQLASLPGYDTTTCGDRL